MRRSGGAYDARRDAIIGDQPCVCVMAPKRSPHGKEKRNCVECNPCLYGVLKTTLSCKECFKCPHSRLKGGCAKCNPCPHGRLKKHCVECNPCPHGKVKNDCRACTPCPHRKLKGGCAVCNRCPHGKLNGGCAVCNLALTTSGKTSARSATLALTAS